MKRRYLIEIRRTVTVVLGLLLSIVAARSQTECRPNVIDKEDSSGNAWMLDLGVVSSSKARQDLSALRTRKLQLAELITDHAEMLKDIRSCFRKCPMGGGSIESNVAFRRCQQGCKSEAIEYIQEFWSKWPEARGGVGVSVGDFGEITVTDRRGEESADARSRFYIASQYAELNSIISKLSAATQQTTGDQSISLMVATSDPESRAGQYVVGLIIWPIDKINATTPVDAQVKVVGMDGSNVIEIVGGFTTGRSDNPWNMVTFRLPSPRAKSFLETLISNRRIVVSIASGIVLQFVIAIDESGQRVLSCIRRDHGL